jgi:hypothetical protein
MFIKYGIAWQVELLSDLKVLNGSNTFKIKTHLPVKFLPTIEDESKHNVMHLTLLHLTG